MGNYYIVIIFTNHDIQTYIVLYLNILKIEIKYYSKTFVTYCKSIKTVLSFKKKVEYQDRIQSFSANPVKDGTT